jgi:FdrA protein
MGAEIFTQGRPHPMIDSTLRRERLLAEAEDPEVAVLLLDFILGYNSSPDPVGDLADAIRAVKAKAAGRGGYLCVVANICGTGGDPQGLAEQTRLLEETGAVVQPSGARAAAFAGALVSALDGGK